MSRRDVELGGRLRECDLIGPGVDSEKEITLPHDVAVLKKYPSECAAHLRAQLHLRDRRELAEEAQPSINVLRQRLAHQDLWKCGRPSTCGTSTRPGRILEPSTHNHDPC